MCDLTQKEQCRTISSEHSPLVLTWLTTHDMLMAMTQSHYTILPAPPHGGRGGRKYMVGLQDNI